MPMGIDDVTSAVLIVSVTLAPFAPGVAWGTENAHDACAGTLVHPNVTGASKLVPRAVTEMLNVAGAPAVTENTLGDAAIAKSGCVRSGSWTLSVPRPAVAR